MNQGNVGAHAGDNGAFHDGGLLLAFPDRVMGVFLAFQTQRVPTDAHGAPASDAQPLSPLISVPNRPATVTSAVYLERALINPTGADPGHEVVVLGNCATSRTSLTGWRLVDRNGRATKLDAELAGGASVIVARSTAPACSSAITAATSCCRTIRPSRSTASPTTPTMPAGGPLRALPALKRPRSAAAQPHSLAIGLAHFGHGDSADPAARRARACRPRPLEEVAQAGSGDGDAQALRRERGGSTR